MGTAKSKGDVRIPQESMHFRRIKLALTTPRPAALPPCIGEL